MAGTREGVEAAAPGRGRRVRFAVVGLGHIAQVAVLPAFAHAGRRAELAALVSGDPRKRSILAKRYGVARTFDYEGYEDCLADPSIDAVYIALPNAQHRDYAVAAARAGKHVLCEKPLAVNVEECEDMIRAAAESSVFLMTAYRLHFDRGNLKAVEIVRSGRIGVPRIFGSHFTMQVRPGNIRLLPLSEGGGPLYDVGVYCINAARYLFRAEPEEVFAWMASSGDDRFERTPETVSALLRFPEERLASFTCGSGAADAGWYEVVGTRGRLRMDPAFEYAQPLEYRLTVGDRSRTARFAKRDQFAAELMYFADCVRLGREPEPSGREGLADVRIVQAMLESARARRPVSLEPFERRRRPTLEQEIHRPPTSKPRLVRVQAPSS